MAEAGGPAAQSGVLYQNTVAAYFLARLCQPGRFAAHETVAEVRSESPGPVDDIVVLYGDGHRDLVHVKENVSPSDDAWRGLWEDFHAALSDSAFGPGDRLCLYVGTPSAALLALREATQRARGSTSAMEWSRRLTIEMRRVVKASVGNIARPEPGIAWKLMSRVYVEVASLEALSEHLLAQLPESSVSPSVMMAALRDRAAIHARERRPFYAIPLLQALENEAGIVVYATRAAGRALDSIDAATIAALSPNVQAEQAHLDRAIASLTSDQFRVLQFLNTRTRAAIAGCAGSGKTIVAVEKAIRLANSGRSVLLLCHSVHLSFELQRRTAQTTVVAFDFTSWIRRLAGAYADVQLGSWTRWDEPTDEELESAFDAIAADKAFQFNDVVVDEGQDFRDTWWILVEACLLQQDGSLFVFHDDNQSLIPHRGIAPIPDLPFCLGRNCRNAGRIFEVVRRLHPQAPAPEDILRTLGHVRFWAVDSLNSPRARVTEALEFALGLLSSDALVVLTTEPDPAAKSILCGLEVAVPGMVRWQVSVERVLSDLQRKLHAMGGTELARQAPLLGYDAQPSARDVEAVQAWAEEAIDWVEAVLRALERPLRWPAHIDPRLLRSHRLGPYQRRRLIPDLDWLRSGRWVGGEAPLVRVLADAEEQDESRHIPLFSVASFKGLEREGVVLFDPSGDRASIYVGASRARFLLCTIGPRSHRFLYADLKSRVGAEEVGKM